MILWFNYNIMDVVNVVMFYLITIPDATNEFLSGDNKSLSNWTGLNTGNNLHKKAYNSRLHEVTCDCSLHEHTQDSSLQM